MEDIKIGLGKPEAFIIWISDDTYLTIKKIQEYLASENNLMVGEHQIIEDALNMYAFVLGLYDKKDTTNSNYDRAGDDEETKEE